MTLKEAKIEICKHYAAAARSAFDMVSNRVADVRGFVPKTARFELNYRLFSALPSSIWVDLVGGSKYIVRDRDSTNLGAYGVLFDPGQYDVQQHWLDERNDSGIVRNWYIISLPVINADALPARIASHVSGELPSRIEALRWFRVDFGRPRVTAGPSETRAFSVRLTVWKGQLF